MTARNFEAKGGRRGSKMVLSHWVVADGGDDCILPDNIQVHIRIFAEGNDHPITAT